MLPTIGSEELGPLRHGLDPLTLTFLKSGPIHNLIESFYGWSKTFRRLGFLDNNELHEETALLMHRGIADLEILGDDHSPTNINSVLSRADPTLGLFMEFTDDPKGWNV